MSFINSNIIEFHGKSRQGSENVEIREQILTLQHSYRSYRVNLLHLSESISLQTTNDTTTLKENLKVIEQQLEILATLIE